MTDKTPDSEERKSQQSSSSQNVRQDIGTNEGQVQGVSAGRDANVIQGRWNFIFNKLLNITLNIFRQEPVLGIRTRRPKTEQLMLGQVKEEVAARLNHSLHNQVYILLDKEEDISQVKPPWAIDVKVGTKPSERLPSETQITDIYDREDINGKLLILGAPGSGKTTTLLQLAQVLVNRAQDDINQPIPVLLNLSSWKEDKQCIKDWIIDDLKQKYGVRKDIGKKWLEETVIIPLLDGLDEIASDRQGLCVDKINEFLTPSIWSSSLVVCSRSEEYQLLSRQDQSQSQIKKLELNGAVILQPLTQEQIENYLQRAGEGKLWQSIKDDESLMELSKTPLLLNIIVISCEKISFSEWQKLSDSKQRLSYLFNAYIKRMLGRPYKGKRLQPEHKKTRRWLGWLAEQLNEDNQTEFLIEKIQPYWLKRKQKQTYKLIGVLITGLVIELIAQLILGLIALAIFWWTYSPGIGLIERLSEDLIAGLIYGLGIGVIVGLGLRLTEKIETVEIIQVNWKKIKISLFGQGQGVGLFIGLTVWLIGLLIFWLNEELIELIWPIAWLIQLLIFWLIWWLISGLSVGLVEGIKSSEIETKTSPNQGIWVSLRNAITVWLIFGIIGCLIGGLLGVLSGETISKMIMGGLIFGLVLGVPLALMNGGKTCIQHFSLRLTLYCNNYISWNYARFLDYATDRLFLQRVGGGYRFIHRLLQEHFAHRFLNGSDP